MTLLSSANNIHSDAEFILRIMSFIYIYIYIYIMNNTDPQIVPWGIPCCSMPQSEKKCWAVLCDFNSTPYLLLVKQGLNQSSVTPKIPYICNLTNKTSQCNRNFIQQSYLVGCNKTRVFDNLLLNLGSCHKQHNTEQELLAHNTLQHKSITFWCTKKDHSK
jgi:hypothetical protein